MSELVMTELKLIKNRFQLLRHDNIKCVLYVLVIPIQDELHNMIILNKFKVQSWPKV